MQNQIIKNVLLSSMSILGAGLVAILLYSFIDSRIPEIAFISSLLSFVALSGLVSMQHIHTIRLIRYAHIDRLTGLSNRHSFMQKLEKTIDHAKQHNILFHVLMIDLNKFKQVNDTLGHVIGDKLLSEIAGKLSEIVRGKHVISRLGGDEFAVLVPDDHSTNKTYEAVVNRITKMINLPINIDGNYIYVGSSIGIATYPTAGTTVTELMRCADIAMYASKKLQRDYAVYNADDAIYSVTDLTLVSELHTAIADNDFELWFQPKRCLHTGAINSAECLIRWNHPVRGLIMPNSFINLAESFGMIKYITQLVIKEAAAGYKKLKEAGFDLSLSINISPNDVVDPTIMTTIIKSIVKSDMSPEKLILEVTETAIMIDPDAAFKVLIALESLGIQLSIDDFGVGHSSLVYLKNFPIHEIKLDCSFITDIQESKEGFNIVKSTIELAHHLNAVTVAEGVESAEIENLLTELHCDFVQGYHIARPMPIDTFIPWLKTYELTSEISS